MTFNFMAGKRNCFDLPIESMLLLLVVRLACGLDNGVASLPRMGWSTWNYFGNAINESLVKQMADALVDTGLRARGFEYVHIDAGALLRDRDASGRLQVNQTLFPSGMAAISAYIHSKNLKFGVYTDIGNTSCGPGPGSYQHYEGDAQTFAEWEIDALKVDFCDFELIPNQLKLWTELRDALNKTGRPIWLYTSPHSGGPDSKVPAQGISAPWHNSHPYAPPLSWTTATRQSLANSMMIQYVNLFDYWYSEHWGAPDSPPSGFITNVDAMTQLSKPEDSNSTAGFWSDAQQLEVCNFGEGNEFKSPGTVLGMTIDEYRSQYSIWAMFASPLILSADLRTLRKRHPTCLDMVLNKDLIAIAQDPLGAAGRLIRQATNLSSSAPPTSIRSDNIVEQVWTRPLADGSAAACFFNRGEVPRNMSVRWAEMGFPAGTPSGRSVRDIWKFNSHGGDVGVHDGGFAAEVASHSVVMIRVAN